MGKRVAVLLSGCGVYDGSEIHEAAFTLLALDQAGVTYQCCAPDKPQAHVINHALGQPTDDLRNVLTESARIARGKIVSLSDIHVGDFDALILPGGFGAAKNLCSYAFDGESARLDPEVGRVIKDFHAAKKPIGAWCIAPVVVALALGTPTRSPKLTIGNDAATAAHIQAFGAEHIECAANGEVTDTTEKIVTTPAYMYDSTPAQVYEGISAAVQALLALT